MGKFFMVLVLGFSFNAMAIELLSHKNTSTGITKISDSEVEKVWASSTPACLKDGSKLMGVNKAYRAKGLKYSDCSSSDKAREKQRLLGFEVVKIDFVALSETMARKVYGK